MASLLSRIKLKFFILEIVFDLQSKEIHKNPLKYKVEYTICFQV